MKYVDSQWSKDDSKKEIAALRWRWLIVRLSGVCSRLWWPV